MNVNDGTVPCPVCGDAIQGSTLRAVVPMRARITELEAEVTRLRATLTTIRQWDMLTFQGGYEPMSDGPWLRGVIDDALVPATTSASAKGDP